MSGLRSAPIGNVLRPLEWALDRVGRPADFFYSAIVKLSPIGAFTVPPGDPGFGTAL